MKQAGWALLWIVATVGGAVLLAKFYGVGTAALYVLAAVIGGIWGRIRL